MNRGEGVRVPGLKFRQAAIIAGQAYPLHPLQLVKVPGTGYRALNGLYGLYTGDRVFRGIQGYSGV